MKRFLAAILCGVIAFAMTSCHTPAPETDGTETERAPEEYITFVLDAEKNEWKDYLVDFIVNTQNPGDVIGFALMDINVDGVPEIWKAHAGGSMMNTFYLIYDLKSGKEIGSYNAGAYEDRSFGCFVTYYNIHDDTYKLVSEGNHRFGWMEETEFVDGFVFDAEQERYERSRMFSIYTEQITEMIDGKVEYLYTDYSYYVSGEEVGKEGYCSALDSFYAQNARIDATEFVLVRIDRGESVISNAEAEEIAEALITSEQKFIKTK